MLTVSLTDVADPDVRRQIAAPLIAFNEAQAGPDHFRMLVITLRDETGATAGGLWVTPASGGCSCSC